MPRYEHYIDRPKRSIWPQQILCVDAISAHYVDGEQLDSWCARLMQKEGDTYIDGGCADSSECQNFWEYVQHVSTFTPLTWILSCGCAEQWALLGLWDELEHGRIIIFGRGARANNQCESTVHSVRGERSYPDVHRPAASLRYLYARGSGYLALDDPPCVARFRFKGSSRWVTWFDARNWSVTIPDGVARGYSATLWLGQFASQLSSALHRYNMGSLCATAASQAMHAYRRTYKHTGVFVNADTRATRSETNAYYGGRCEAFSIGAITPAVRYIDIRSSYGAAMHTTSVPVRMRDSTDCPMSAERRGESDPTTALADVTIETDEPAYPYRVSADQLTRCVVQPMSSVNNGSSRGALIIYPTGRYRTTLAGPELADALLYGRIRVWHALAWYHCEKDLESYAREIYNMRTYAEQNGQACISMVAKQLLVCLPGKLAQRNRTWIDCENHDGYTQYGTWLGTDPTGNTCRYRAIAGHVQREHVDGLATDAVPAMAAWITSAARVHLLNLIRCAGWENVYYVDTDGLLVNERGYNAIDGRYCKDSYTLGGIVQKAKAGNATIYGIKNYDHSGRRVRAGDITTARNTFIGDSPAIRYRQPAEYIIAGRKPGIEKVNHSHERRAQYLHGVVLDDGRVRPWHIVDGKLT